MLTIHNRPDGTIADTDYWQSEYNARGLAYDGTDSPFSLCLDRTQQLDTALRSGSTRLLVYAGSLQNPLELPCTITLPDAPKQNYLTYATASTGHSRRSYRSEVADDVVAAVKSWLPDLMAGQQRGVLDDRYAARQEWGNGKSIGFVVSRLDAQMRPVEIVKIAVCRHSKRAVPAWRFVEGKGAPPRVPFVASGLLYDNVEASDLMALPVIADFERCLAWAWLEYIDAGGCDD